MKHPLIIPALVAVMGGAAVLGTTQVFAQQGYSGSSPLAQKIAEKFGLQETEVQAVFDEVRAEHETEMKARLETKLSGDVAAGKITEEQKAKILVKLGEIKFDKPISKDAFKTMNHEEHKAQMEAHRAELDLWAKDNGIDPSYLRFPIMKRIHMQ